MEYSCSIGGRKKFPKNFRNGKGLGQMIQRKSKDGQFNTMRKKEESLKFFFFFFFFQ